MASLPGDFAPQNRSVAAYIADQRFYVRFALLLATVILAGFFQWEARGMADIRAVPLWVHLHAALMVCWLGLLVTQNVLANGGALNLHRKLGRVSALVVAGILASGLYTGFRAVELQRIPPFFTEPYFLALTITELTMFAVLVAVGIGFRRRTEWHRRIMLGATIVLLEPSLGRILPMPLMGHWAEWAIMALQLCFIAVIARHDLMRRGGIHPATVAIGAAVVLTHVTMTLLAGFAPFAAYANAMAGSA